MARLEPGDRVALLLPGSAEYVDVVIALLAEGVFPIPLDPSLTSYELTRMFATLDPTLVIRDDTGLAAVADLLASYQPRGLPLGRPMHCTSGTTGTPKGVFSGVLAPDDARSLVAEEQQLWGFAAGDVNLVLSPIYHSAPLRFAMGTLLAGGRIVIPGPFDPSVITAAIECERPTSMFCVPAHLQRLFAHWDQNGWPDLTSFRLVAHAGAPCPEAIKRRLIEAFPEGSVWEFYGSTEGQFTACPSSTWLAHPGTLGPARPGRQMSADDDGQLWCEVPAYARFSYYGDVEKTAAAWRGDAFTVGELGRVDDNGLVWLEGRRVDLIISGGVNVYPAEVEAVLGDVPGVDDIAVFGVPDEKWGQKVVAAVVGAARDADLDAHARTHLTTAKRPKEYRHLDTLPRTSTGKVLRRELS